MSQKEMEDKIWKLIDDQKREKEELEKKYARLEAKLDKKQALEMEIVSLRGAIEVTKVTTDIDTEGMVEALEKELNHKKQQLLQLLLQY